MWNRVRTRLALLFVLITAVVYVVSTAGGLRIFESRLNGGLDDEIAALIVETRSTLKNTAGAVLIQGAARAFNQPVSIQLYDTGGKLLQRVGMEGVPQLVNGTAEARSHDGITYRSCSITLPKEDPVYGVHGTPFAYLQVQVSTRHRDQAIKQFLETQFVLAPLVLFALVLAAVRFSDWAIQPANQAMTALRNFLGDAGHELTTPIATMRATCENLALEIEGNAAAERRLETLLRTNERMAKLVADMSTLAALESAQVVRPFAPVNLEELVRDLVQSFESLFADKKIELKCVTEKVTITGDKTSLEELVSNLLQNALRYTDEGGKVEVRLSRVNDRAVLQVNDSGIGIPPDSVPHVFDRFYRVDKSRSRAAGGSGLGLALVKATAEIHGGFAWVKSTEGAGSTFGVEIPLSK